MWTLAHTHGTLLSLVHIAFALSLGTLGCRASKSLQVVSTSLLGSLLLMPLGFFLGGVWLYGGDPGLGSLLVPVGALMMLLSLAVFLRLIIADS